MHNRKHDEATPLSTTSHSIQFMQQSFLSKKDKKIDPFQMLADDVRKHVISSFKYEDILSFQATNKQNYRITSELDIHQFIVNQREVSHLAAKLNTLDREYKFA